MPCTKPSCTPLPAFSYAGGERSEKSTSTTTSTTGATAGIVAIFNYLTGSTFNTTTTITTTSEVAIKETYGPGSVSPGQRVMWFWQFAYSRERETRTHQVTIHLRTRNEKTLAGKVGGLDKYGRTFNPCLRIWEGTACEETKQGPIPVCDAILD